MKLLEYIFYKIFRMHSKGEDSITAAGLAVVTTSVLFFANIFTIYVSLRKLDIIPRVINKPVEAVFLMVTIIVIDYFIFMHRKKYLEIIDKFNNETKRQRITGSLLVLFYGIFSFVLIILVSMFKPGYL